MMFSNHKFNTFSMSHAKSIIVIPIDLQNHHSMPFHKHNCRIKVKKDQTITEKEKIFKREELEARKEDMVTFEKKKKG